MIKEIEPLFYDPGVFICANKKIYNCVAHNRCIIYVKPIWSSKFLFTFYDGQLC